MGELKTNTNVVKAGARCDYHSGVHADWSLLECDVMLLNSLL
jgi:hypothetical protein